MPQVFYPSDDVEVVPLDEVRAVASGDAFRWIEDRELLARLLQVCTPRQERILRLSFGIGCAPMPTTQIAASLDLTRHQIRNLRDNALIRMRIEVQLLDDPAGEVAFGGEVYRAGWREFDAAYRNLLYMKAVGREVAKSEARRRGREFHREYQARQAVRRGHQPGAALAHKVSPDRLRRQEDLLDQAMIRELAQLVAAILFMVVAPYAGFVEYGRAGAVMCFVAGMAFTYAVISLTATRPSLDQRRDRCRS
jgi:DNA-binding CsgD family transcriptional regulator